MSRVEGVPGGLPRWLDPVVAGLQTISASDLTRFVPPDDVETREGAVLILFADREAPAGQMPGELLLTERNHTMRSHPGQVSFPGGGVDPGETPQECALRESWEETGLDPAEVTVFGELPRLWLPPSNFAVTPVLGYWHSRTGVDVVSPDEVHAIHHAPIAELLDPRWRITVRAPNGYQSPGFLIGDSHDVIVWGFTAGIISRLFLHIGWSGPWDTDQIRDLPDYMLKGVSERLALKKGAAVMRPNTDFVEREVDDGGLSRDLNRDLDEDRGTGAPGASS